MKPQYFAIRRGRRRGIFFALYSAILPLVEGFRGAEFAGFPTWRSAEIYLEDGVSRQDAIERANRELHGEAIERLAPITPRRDRPPIASGQSAQRAERDTETEPDTE